MLSYSTYSQTPVFILDLGMIPPLSLPHVSCTAELWTLVLIPVFSCLYTGSWLCSPWSFVSSCSLTKSLFCAAQLSSSLFSLWLQPLNHKYSPAGNQTRADMNPEAQQDVSVSQRIRMMFYMMKPNETSFQILEEVPDYVKQVRLSGKRLLLLFS